MELIGRKLSTLWYVYLTHNCGLNIGVKRIFFNHVTVRLSYINSFLPFNYFLGAYTAAVSRSKLSLKHQTETLDGMLPTSALSPLYNHRADLYEKIKLPKFHPRDIFLYQHCLPPTQPRYILDSCL